MHVRKSFWISNENLFKYFTNRGLKGTGTKVLSFFDLLVLLISDYGISYLHPKRHTKDTSKDREKKLN